MPVTLGDAIRMLADAPGADITCATRYFNVCEQATIRTYTSVNTYNIMWAENISFVFYFYIHKVSNFLGIHENYFLMLFWNFLQIWIFYDIFKLGKHWLTTQTRKNKLTCPWNK